MAAGPANPPGGAWFEWPLRVYWEDTDAGGIVYYANYLKFAERARTEMLRAAGIDQSRLKAETGIVFAVTQCTIRYRRPARLDDRLTLLTRIAKQGAASLVMDQRVERGEEMLCELTVQVACVNEEGRPARLPEAVRRALAATVQTGERELHV